MTAMPPLIVLWSEITKEEKSLGGAFTRLCIRDAARARVQNVPRIQDICIATKIKLCNILVRYVWYLN